MRPISRHPGGAGDYSTILRRRPTKAAAESDSRAAELRGGLLAGGRFLGLLTSDPQQWFRARRHNRLDGGRRVSIVWSKERDSARARKGLRRPPTRFATISRARGVIVEDMPEGARWRRK